MNHFCKEASQLQSDGFERSLTLMERVQLRIHLLICAACRNYSENLKLLNNIFHGLRKQQKIDENVSLPDSDRDRIKEVLKNTSDSGS
jgi:predicted anti-sigma-YlaC factor YlaD